MLGKIVLWISAVSFIGYGLACLFSPELPAGYAGLGIVTGDGYVELGAMYGGLQTGFGIIALLGAVRADAYRPALAALVIVVGCLALGRLFSTLTVGDAVGAYTWGAMAFEFLLAILAAIALRGAPQPQTA